jgi:hypothetical protein
LTITLVINLGTAHRKSLVPANKSRNWDSLTSNSGCTSDSGAYKWLTTVFEPETRLESPEVRGSLVVDGHGINITADVSAHRTKRASNLSIFLPCRSQILQPLDTNVLSPSKRAPVVALHDMTPVVVLAHCTRLVEIYASHLSFTCAFQHMESGLVETVA